MRVLSQVLSTSLFIALILSVAQYRPVVGQEINGTSAVVWTDKEAYLPGQEASVSAVGFSPFESVDFRVFLINGDGVSLSGIDSANLGADAGGNVTYAWTLPGSLEFEDVIQIRLVGELSGTSVTTSFTVSNTELTLTSSIGGPLCVGVVDDSIVVCARLTQFCKGGSVTSVSGREIQFFLSGDNCGVSVGQVADFTISTDDFGIACFRLPAPDTASSINIRAKFSGESKPDECLTPGNSPCDPFADDARDRCVNLSNANACLELNVGGDVDDDGIADADDNCPCVFNPLQEDFDNDGLGDSCFLPAYLRPLTIWLHSSPPETDSVGNPIDLHLNLRVTDPDFLQIGADSFNIIINDFGDGAAYHNLHGNDSIVIEYPKTGAYIIEILPEAGFSSPPGLPAVAAFDYKVSVRTDGTVEFVSEASDAPTSGIIDTLGYESIPFALGDANGDRIIDVADVIFLIAVIFSGGPAPIPIAAGDANCDGSLNVSDISFLIRHIFALGIAPSCD